MSDLSLIKFHLTNFYAVYINRIPFSPIYLTLLTITRGLIDAEPTLDVDLKKKVDWIYNFTHLKVNEPLSTIEFVVFKNLDKSLAREVDIGDKQFYLIELYNHMNDIAKELSEIVNTIAKKYNVDIPMLQFNRGGQISL